MLLVFSFSYCLLFHVSACSSISSKVCVFHRLSSGNEVSDPCWLPSNCTWVNCVTFESLSVTCPRSWAWFGPKVHVRYLVFLPAGLASSSGPSFKFISWCIAWIYNPDLLWPFSPSLSVTRCNIPKLLRFCVDPYFIIPSWLKVNYSCDTGQSNV